MMKLITLIEIEIKKLLPLLLVIFGLMTVASIALFRSSSNSLNNEIMRTLAGGTVADYIAANGQVTLAQAVEMSFGLHYFLFGAAAVLLVASSTFYLWYKEWFGQSKRIYMLFSLRGSRFTILLSKLITVLGATFIFYGVILLNLFIGNIVFSMIMPDGIVSSDGVSSVLAQATTWGLGFSFPLSFTNFLYKIFFVMVGFSGISVWVLLDRSKKIWGFILGGIYTIALATIFIRTQTMFLFFDERPLVDWGFVLGASAISLLISYLLLNKKVSI